MENKNKDMNPHSKLYILFCYGHIKISSPCDFLYWVKYMCLQIILQRFQDIGERCQRGCELYVNDDFEE